MNSEADLFEHVIGFDVRFGPQHYVNRRWPPTSRQEYLLRPEIDWPMSIDDWVWPSAFRYARKQGSVALGMIDGVIDTSPLDFWHEVLDLWTDLGAMVDRIERDPVSRTHHLVPIVITVLCFPEERPKDSSGPDFFFSETKPDRRPADWKLVGYDIADRGRISGLSNCGYTIDELTTFRKTWAFCLNDYGLAATIKDAFALKAATDLRVQEHAPFWVFALYRQPVTTPPSRITIERPGERPLQG